MSKNPAVPVTPSDIAQSCVEACNAGAAIVHIHVRDPDTGAPSNELAHYREVVERIRGAGCDVLINLTTGYGQRIHLQNDNIREMGPKSNIIPAEERIAHIRALSPDICSLDVATMNSGNVFGDTIMVNATDQLNRMAKGIREAGTKPELEIFDVGHIRLALNMLEEGVIDKPPFFQFALGVKWGAAANAQTIDFMRRMIPADAQWAAFGISRECLPAATLSFLMGGHMRVGLEDNLYLEAGVLAPSNAALVEQAAQVVKLHGGNVASPAEARDILSLKGG